jgi:hypothetical protein
MQGTDKSDNDEDEHHEHQSSDETPEKPAAAVVKSKVCVTVDIKSYLKLNQSFSLDVFLYPCSGFDLQLFVVLEVTSCLAMFISYFQYALQQKYVCCVCAETVISWQEATP